MTSPHQSRDPEPLPRLPSARVWVVGDDAVAAALADASDRVDPVPVDPDRPPAEPPSAVVAAGADALDAPLPAVETALVGPGVDAVAGYEAGADAVVPVDPTGRPGPVVAWLERAVDRADEAARYRALFDETGDGIVVHDAATGDVVEANDRFRSLLGLDLNRPVTVETFAGADEAHDADRARELVREAATEGPLRFEWVDAPPGGDRVDVEVTLSPATLGGRDRVVATVRNVSERTERRERFERTLERVDDAFFALDENWRFTYLNEAGTAVINGAAETELSAEQLRGRHIWELIPEAVDTQFHEAYTAAMEHQEPRTFESYYPPLGTWFEVRAYPSPEGLSVYFSDISERRRREDAMRELFDTAQALMSAESHAAVAERLAEAATATLGFAATGVRLRTPDDRLEPVAIGGTAPSERPTLAMDSPHGRALRDGAPVVDEVDDDDAYGRADYERVLYVPVGDHGVLSLGRTEGGFAEADRRLAGLLAALGAAAFDRVDRAAELRRYEAVLETAEGMMFVVDEDRRFSLVTEPLAAHLGYDREEIVGHHVSDVLDEETVTEAGTVREALLTTPGAGSRTFEVDVRAADGNQIPIEVELSALDFGDERGTVGVVTDRSALRDARADLATERDRLTYLFENLPDPTVEYDVDPLSGEAVVRSVNPAFRDAFDVDRGPVVGRPLGDVIPNSRAPDAPERVVGASPGDVVRAEIGRDAAEERRRFLFRGVSFEAEDRVRAFGIYTDITAQHRRERYLKIVGRVLRHNLRNDLTVMLALVGRLRAQVGDAAGANAALDQIAEVVDDLTTLGDDARDLARVVGSDGAVRRTTVDLAAVARRVADAVDVQVEVALPDDLLVVADERLDRALAEVVENSVEHAPGHPPRITVETDGEWVELRVADDGPGVPETERVVVAGDRPITQTEHGSGLGLWLARWLVEDAGGRFSFADPDEGTTVVFHFPRA